MGSMDDLNKILINTAIGYVPPQTMESYDADKVLIRRQQIIAPHRFTILVMHPTSGHYCGYVYVNLALLTHILATSPAPSYAGPGTREISWRWFNSQRKLVTQGRVGIDDDQDFWVGVAFSKDSNPEKAAAVLTTLEREVNLIRENRK